MPDNISPERRDELIKLLREAGFTTKEDVAGAFREFETKKKPKNKSFLDWLFEGGEDV